MLSQILDKKAIQDAIGGKPLSDLLDEIDVQLGKLKGAGQQAVKIFLLMDEAYNRVVAAPEDGLKAEKAQYEYILASIEKNAGGIVREIGGPAKMQELRDKYQPESDKEWWFLDQYLAQQSKTNMVRILKWATGIVVILVILGVVYQRFFAPDPALIAKMNHQMGAQDALSSGDTTRALSEIEGAIKSAPDDASLYVIKGVILQKMNRTDEAKQTYQQAEQMLGGQEKFLLTRAAIYNQANDPEAAAADCQEVIRINPESAEGYYYLGIATEALRDLPKAVEYYQTASGLAESQKRPELSATIRINLAMAMQSMQSMLPGLEITPTPEN